MTTFLVLASPGAQIPDEHSVVIADRFALLAFIAPVIWLLFHRLWLEAVAAALVLATATMLASSAAQPALGTALSLALSLITALEGRNWRAAALQRRGWWLVDVVEADDPELAFEVHAARATKDETAPRRPEASPNRSPLILGRQPRRETGSIGLVPVERN